MTVYLPFSGVNCVGLIEATPSSPESREACSFSGVNCAGLIEAPAVLSMRKACRLRFPALIAPASLKRAADGRLARAQRRFPALIAPASLKRNFYKKNNQFAQAFSGVNCAGLIEARPASEIDWTAMIVFRR